MNNETQSITAIERKLSRKELCDLLSISTQTAKRLEIIGSLIPFRVEGRVFYDSDKIREAMFYPMGKL